MLADVTMKSRLLAAFLLLALVSVLVGAVGLSASGRLAAQAEGLAEEVLPSLRAVGQVQAQFVVMRFHATRAVLSAMKLDPEGVADAHVQRERARKLAEAGLARYASIPKAG
ncbi:MAG TPA: MCP four helix bundle domain-containing protein, partial [Anaeromyxobacter sp.]|nr:MCP four helix bundle domain-containing protein [Anaeromyxobacter sp.]